MSAPVDWILDMDLARFFDTMPHWEIVAVSAERIADRAFLRLIARMLKAGVQTPGGVVYDELGSPQGSIVSPVIANVFLDHVLDPWFATVVRQHCRGYCVLLRYADDALVLFECEDDAQRFLRVLPLRLGKCGLRLNAQKTRLLACGKRHAWQAFRARQRCQALTSSALPITGDKAGPGRHAEAQNLEEAIPSRAGGAQSLAPPRAQHAETP